ncbi:TPA: hypothetical protein N0F65_006329 [Lagenidium giganteum]|uniref:Uncharacterized protein n=1 Tax=Lagenidium giganteum TaxID=4803 RepID=A0AAV2YM96_9STRA|nr:TPA: hypothetical protein N0F65_006329 [Lagenidium giganteum]
MNFTAWWRTNEGRHDFNELNGTMCRFSDDIQCLVIAAHAGSRIVAGHARQKVRSRRASRRLSTPPGRTAIKRTNSFAKYYMTN